MEMLLTVDDTCMLLKLTRHMFEMGRKTAVLSRFKQDARSAKWHWAKLKVSVS